MSLECLQRKHKEPNPGHAASCCDPAGWAALYRAHWPAVYARCKRLLRDPHAAEDAAQETFVRALRHSERLPDHEQQARWLSRVAVNYCLNQLRDARRHRELLDGLQAAERAESPTALTALELTDCLMASVPEKVWHVARLMYLEDQQQSQVAGALGISRRTVVSRLAAFRADVRRATSER